MRSVILADELVVRRDRQIARRTKAAAFRDQKKLDDFGCKFNTSVKRKLVFDMAALPVSAKAILFKASGAN